PSVLGGATNDGRIRLLEQSGAPIHVLAGTRPKAKVMETNSLLNEPLVCICGITRFNADRGSRANPVDELVAIEYQLHSKLRQELPIECAGQIKAAYRQDDVGHAIYADHAHFPAY